MSKFYKCDICGKEMPPNDRFGRLLPPENEVIGIYKPRLDICMECLDRLLPQGVFLMKR